MLFSASSTILILSMVFIQVSCNETYCHNCDSRGEPTHYCNAPSIILSISCKSIACGKKVVYQKGKLAELRRFCAYTDYEFGCQQIKKNISNSYTEYCYCEGNYCNEAVKFTWSLFVNLPLVVSSLFAMF